MLNLHRAARMWRKRRSQSSCTFVHSKIRACQTVGNIFGSNRGRNMLLMNQNFRAGCHCRSFDASNTCPPTNFTICWADPCLGKWNVMELHPIGGLELIKLQHVKLCMPPDRAFLARTHKRVWQAFVGILFLETPSISNLVKRIHPDGSVPNEIGRCPYPSFCPCPCPVLSSQP